MSESKPRRSHEFCVWIGADTREEMIGHLFDLARRLERGEVSVGISGGYGSGSVYAYQHDPSITHDSYFAEIDKHLNRLSSPPPDTSRAR